MKTLIRPVSDEARNGWTDDGGGTSTIYTKLEEAVPSDAAFVMSPATPTDDEYIVKLDTISAPPAGPRVLRYRFEKDPAGSGVQTLTVRLLQGPGPSFTQINAVVIPDVHEPWLSGFLVITGTVSDWSELYVGLNANQTTCPAGAVAATTGTLTSLIASSAANTVFCLADGTYNVPSGLWTPKTGMKFYGSRAAIISGADVRSRPFNVGSVTGVECHGMTFQHFTEVGLALGTGWIADDIESKLNGLSGSVGTGFGIKHDAAVGAQLRNSYIHDNERYGIGGPGSSGCVIEGNEFTNNNTGGHTQLDADSGGSKWYQTVGTVVRNNHWHDEPGVGIWFDTDNVAGYILDNLIEDCDWWGIHYEISYHAQIARNTVRRSGDRGIYISSSGGEGTEVLDVSFNTVECGSQAGITIGQETRGTGTLGDYLSQNVKIHDNTVEAVGHAAGEVFDVGPGDPFASGNVWRKNHYHVDSLSNPRWPGGRTWAQWQTFGQDTTAGGATAAADGSCP